MPLLNDAQKVYVGSAEANSVYQGSNLIYEKQTIPPWTFSPMQAPSYDPPQPLDTAKPPNVPSLLGEMVGPARLRISWETSVTQFGIIGAVGWGMDAPSYGYYPHPFKGTDLSQFTGIHTDFVEAPYVNPAVFPQGITLAWFGDVDVEPWSGTWVIGPNEQWPAGGKTVNFATDPPDPAGITDGGWMVLLTFAPFTTVPGGEMFMTLPWARYETP